MVIITNDVDKFLQEDGELFIYGGGNPGYWTGYYMMKCGMEFSGYIDRSVVAVDDTILLEKKVYSLSQVLGSKKKIRMIIAVGNPEEVLGELQWHNELDLLCLVPCYEDYITKRRVYDINKFLSYFRSRLIKVDIPTILSNSCNAGFIYRMLGVKRISPTINNVICPEDFLKICKEPYKYLSKDITLGHWALYNGERHPVGKIEDVSVHFVHDTVSEDALKRWNSFRQRINWDNFHFIMSEDISLVPYMTAREFCQLQERHLLILQKNNYKFNFSGSIYMNHNHFHIRNSAIENYFDLLGWINREYEIE